MTWHAHDLLAAYAAGTLPPPHVASVEEHVAACPSCRESLAGHVATDRLERVWAGVAVALHAPPATSVERLLLRLRVPSATARLVAATAGPSLSWLAATTIALTFALAAAHASGVRGVMAFLLIAPVLPVLGVAAGYGPGLDPAEELVTASPTDGFRLLLLRATAVVGPSTVLTGLAALALPVGGWVSAAWLLPSLALTSLTLALGRWVRLPVAAGALTAAWFGLVTVTAGSFRAGALVDAATLSLAGQLACVVLVAVAAVLVTTTGDRRSRGRVR